MITKNLVFLTLTAAALSSCGTVQSQSGKAGSQESSDEPDMTDEEEAANRVYLDEVEDSAEEEDEQATQVDSSVQDDISDRRLTQMANMKFDRLDKDNSDSLTLDEFLSGLRENPKFSELSSDKQSRRIARITSDFKKYAGTDELLVLDELKTLLKELAPRVGRHRHKGHHGHHRDRIKQTAEEILKQYDKDGDQKLSQEEIEVMRAERSQKHKAWGKRKHKKHGPEQIPNGGQDQAPPPPPGNG